MRFAILLAVILAAGCTKKPKAVAPTPSSSTSSGGGGTGYQPGGGALQNVRQAARRAVVQAELHNLGLEVEMEYNATGKMPSGERVKELAKSTPKLAEAIGDGSLIVTGTTDHGGVWAYEADAPEKGGLALIGPTAMRVDSLELTNKLKQ